MFKYYSDNLEKFKCEYKRNFQPCTLSDVQWGGGTAEALKNSLSQAPITDGCMLAYCNEFNKLLGDMNKFNNANDDNNIYCNIYDGILVNNHTKSEGKLYVPNPSMAVCGFVQPQYLVNKIQKENDHSSLFKRIFISTLYVEFTDLDEDKTIDEVKVFLPSCIRSVIINDINSGKTDAIYRLNDEAFEVYREIYNRTQQKCTMYMKALEYELIGDISKSDDQIPRCQNYLIFYYYIITTIRILFYFLIF